MATKHFTIYKLLFTTPLHIGDARDDYGVSQHTICSDTIYAALTSCLVKVGAAIPDDGDLGCTISSLFPFYQANKESQAVLFMPKPLGMVPPQLQDVSKAKQVKKVAWLDLQFFERAINGQSIFESESDIAAIHGEYLTTAAIRENFIDSQVNQRVTISRTGREDAKPFFMDRVSFLDDSGLFFLCEGDTSKLDVAMNILQEEGIGTDRNVGNGFFCCEKNGIELELPDEAAAQMSLSMYIPESNEQYLAMADGPRVAYELQRRGGWITTPPNNTLRKNVIYAFTAGSVFANCEQSGCIKGAIVDLRPETPQVEHPIWRCGRALFIPIK